jgi:hypothetical protein
MRETMSGLQPNLRKLAASLLLCILVIASVAAPICPACSKIELPTAKHVALSSAGHDGSPNCDKDGCSCCGFQIVTAPLAPNLGLTASTLAPAPPSVQLLTGSVFALYHPPRR